MVAGGIGVVAEVADDLHETLLLCCGFEKSHGNAAEKSLARELENGIVLTSRPEKVARFGGFCETLVAPGERPHIQPRKHNVDGQISYALFAEQWLRVIERSGFQRPSVAPEFVVVYLQDFGEGRNQVRALNFAFEPAVELFQQITAKRPVSRRGEPALRMIGRADAAKSPDITWQFELI